MERRYLLTKAPYLIVHRKHTKTTSIILHVSKQFSTLESIVISQQVGGDVRI